MEFFLCIALSLALLLFLKVILFSDNSTSSSHEKRKLPPSPPSLPIIGHLYMFKKPLHRALARVTERYGPVLLLRFGSRPVLVVSSASAAEECFTTNDIAFANRPRLPSTRYISYNYTTPGTAPYGAYWRNLRRIATGEVLGVRLLQSSSDVRATEVRAMASHLFQYAKAGFAKVELKSRLFALVINVFMVIIAGKRYYGEEGRISEESKKFMEVAEGTVALAGASNIRDFLPFLRWLDYGREVRKRLTKLERMREELMQGLIDEHRRESEEVKQGTGGEEEKKTTTIARLLSMQKDDPEHYSDHIVKSLITVSVSFSASPPLHLRRNVQSTSPMTKSPSQNTLDLATFVSSLGMTKWNLVEHVSQADGRSAVDLPTHGCRGSGCADTRRETTAT
ncbi:hypothetical protein BHE74_00041001 [Ensete ventricosum]|nr:hypothetical protein GW17_00019093 [Ensete ventricosum]RWW52566.1 hypothetical protein BHE74_00041001 [Ensete ventricosum]RZS10423.1 hypothetical protein BHM03_00041649 [Ensete ventricosum]